MLKGIATKFSAVLFLKDCYPVTLELTCHRHQVDMVSKYDFLVFQVLNIHPFDNELSRP